MEAISFQGVTKTFRKASGGELTAVDNVTIDIHRGEIFCLVGPDGAGKTTAVRMMCGVLPATMGSVTVMGLDIRTQREEVKRHIGYLSQRFSLYADLTVDENIDFFAEIHRATDFATRKTALLEMTRLSPFRDRLAGQLSGGMKQKLALACTLVHQPDVIFLDEPTTGVDPVSRRDFWRILSSLLKDGITIVVTTPYLDEAERSTRVALMDHGRIVRCDAPGAVRDGFPFDVFEVTTDDVHAVAESLKKSIAADRVHVFGDRLHILLPHFSERSGIPQELQHFPSETVRSIAPSLEDVFIQQTHQSEARS